MAPAIATITDTKHRGRSWGISPSIERARASREKAVTPAPAPSAEPKPAPIAAPETVKPSIELEGRILSVISNYGDLQNAMRKRVDELRLTRLEVDNLSGNNAGYSAKVLCGMKRFGRQSLGDTMGAVGVFLVLVESSEQVAKLRAVADALSTLGETAAAALDEAAAALGISSKEFKQIARSAPSPTKMGELGGTLISAEAKLALVEDAAATKRVMARAEQRQRPLRQVKAQEPAE